MAFRQKMQALTRHARYLFQSAWEGQFFSYLSTTILYLVRGIGRGLFLLHKEREQVGWISAPSMRKLQRQTQGLHALLGENGAFSYAIFLPWTHPTEKELEISLEAAFSQTAPQYKVYLAKPKTCSATLENMIERYKNQGLSLYFIEKGETIAEQLNRWVDGVRENFLLILFPGCWLRTDCLFRIEQYLRLFSSEERRDLVLFFEEACLSKTGHFIHSKRLQKNGLFLPYLFQDPKLGVCVFSKELLLRAGSFPNVEQPVLFFALLLRLDLAGGQCKQLPFPLFAKPLDEREGDFVSFLPYLKRYSLEKKLSWDWKEGTLPGTFRAIPSLFQPPIVRAVVPFRDQKEFTLKTVRSFFRQKGIVPRLTAVDNRSQDPSIGEEVTQLGGEILLAQEPFNYSRLNNFGVLASRYQEEEEWLLFLNNDVELEEHAVEEMSRWISQPHIGAVGCHLSYPDGTLQHGGVEAQSVIASTYFDPTSFTEGTRCSMLLQHRGYVGWDHREAHLPLSRQKKALSLGIVPAVTAACLLVRRTLFLEVGGFDEVWYPIAFSDTHFCQKLQERGWLVFYTPYARGIHHESASRQRDNIEDVESSLWLQCQV